MSTNFTRALVPFFMYPASVFESRFAFNEIFDWDNETLESKHDYIQWYFPLTVPSMHHPDAPVLDYEQLTFLRSKKGIRFAPKIQSMAFKRMLEFYGFKMTFGFIRQRNCWSKVAPYWFNPGGMDHNYLRITRILTSLVLFSNHKLAKKFYNALLTANEEFELQTQQLGIPESVLEFWRSAVEDTNVNAILTGLRLSPTCLTSQSK